MLSSHQLVKEICLKIINIRYLKPYNCGKIKVICIKTCNNKLIGLESKVFTNVPGDLSSIQGRIIPKTLKIVLDTSLLHTQQYKVRIEVKWSNPEKGVASSSTLRWRSYWNGSLLVDLDYGRQLHFTYNKLQLLIKGYYNLIETI